MDEPEGGAGRNVERSGQHATLKKKRAKKVRAPQREGWLEVYQEMVHVAYLETDKQVYKRKWVMLRDCWLYLYDNQDHVTLGRDAPSVVSIDLRGAVCNRELELERTFYLESSYLYSVQGLKHKIHCRTAAEEDIQVWSAVMSNPDHCRYPGFMRLPPSYYFITGPEPFAQSLSDCLSFSNISTCAAMDVRHQRVINLGSGASCCSGQRRTKSSGEGKAGQGICW